MALKKKTNKTSTLIENMPDGEDVILKDATSRRFKAISSDKGIVARIGAF
ncbi:predicted protein [Sclerotinia sclerotiorum 1980 UF-70]|uniref:Uncharacterized protein n=1 Tax=Sclerotinia sclerotiorum (strain ATCC 18683 / 1980 / Ss-1) TaxID=665079 RepID=A7F9W3_SCLS1|nr:predicted protein [Sclerotinia sclerotiorum 1980 UF-70]EDO00524.1 predicted protein [Sclerotinia sclerotiorum 1980 UF-70]